jgi:hypothetical protein
MWQMRQERRQIARIGSEKRGIKGAPLKALAMRQPFERSLPFIECLAP